MLNALAPDLTVLEETFCNDWRQSLGVVASQTAFQDQINQARLTGDVVFVTPPWDISSSGDVAIQQQYSNGLTQVALANNVPILHARASWVSNAAATAVGWYSSDHQHPSFAGCGARASTFSEFIRKLRSI